jgi:hypothetical protein
VLAWLESGKWPQIDPDQLVGIDVGLEEAGPLILRTDEDRVGQLVFLDRAPPERGGQPPSIDGIQGASEVLLSPQVVDVAIRSGQAQVRDAELTRSTEAEQ